VGKLEGRTALVTGGSRGIGRAVSLRFAREGANLAINYAGNEAAAREEAEEARALGVRAEVYQADVADASAVATMCERAITDFGQIDALINNAGLGSSHVDRPTMSSSDEPQYWQAKLSRRKRLNRVKAGGRSWATYCFSDTTLGSAISNEGEWMNLS